MRLVATTCARNEDWVLGLSARAIHRWCDHLVLFNHASSDRTGEVAARLIDEYPQRITYLADDDPTWKEMAHRQRMLDAARDVGATHIAIVDADEVVSGNLLDIECPKCRKPQAPRERFCRSCRTRLDEGVDNLRVRRLIERIPEGGIFQLPMAGLARSVDRYYVDGIWGWNNFVSVVFADRPECHWQSRNGYDFHHRHPMGMADPIRPYRPVKQGTGAIMHLQFVSERRLRAKQALYKMTEVIRWPDKFSVQTVNERYNKAVYDGGATADVPSAWWAPYADLMEHLRLDEREMPWQERQCHEYLEQYGRKRFEGLDLFGVFDAASIRHQEAS
jgi:hypothetical protein